jgi:hypothetical protein
MNRESKILKDFHQQGILIMGFLGGIAFAGLVLVISAKTTLESPQASQTVISNGFKSADQYFNVLLVLLAIISVLSFYGSFAMLQVGSGRVSGKGETFFDWLALACMLGTMFGLMLLLYYLLLPFTVDGARDLLGVELGLGLIVLIGLGVSSKWPKGKPKKQHPKRKGNDNRLPPPDEKSREKAVK